VAVNRGFKWLNEVGYLTSRGMKETTATTLILDLFSRTAWVSRYQKGGTILDFNEARDDGVVVASA